MTTAHCYTCWDTYNKLQPVPARRPGTTTAGFSTCKEDTTSGAKWLQSTAPGPNSQSPSKRKLLTPGQNLDSTELRLHTTAAGSRRKKFVVPKLSRTYDCGKVALKTVRVKW